MHMLLPAQLEKVFLELSFSIQNFPLSEVALTNYLFLVKAHL